MKLDTKKRLEIGSEFWDVPQTEECNGIFPESTQWFLSGRAALTSIIKDIQSKHNVTSVYMPSWCCDSMINPFLEAGVAVRFYPVYIENGSLRQDISDIREEEILFLMDYFGYQTEVNARKSNAVVIRDLTHSIFSGARCDADYSFGSLRKWAGFYTGGFALGVSGENLSSDDAYVNLRRTAMLAKSSYINGFSDNKDYLDLFHMAEEQLEHGAPTGAAPEDIRAAQHMNVSFIREQRRKNAAILMDAFADWTIFPALNEKDCPLFVPILVPEGKRNELRSHLIQNKIYCPVHWPRTNLHRLDEQTAHIYENELSLVCDQRYNELDMKRIVDVIRSF